MWETVWASGGLQRPEPGKNGGKMKMGNGAKFVLAVAGAVILSALLIGCDWFSAKNSGSDKKKSVTIEAEDKKETKEEWKARIKDLREKAEDGGTISFKETDLFTVKIDISGVTDDVYVITMPYMIDGDSKGMQTVADYGHMPLAGTLAYTLSPLEFPEDADYTKFSFWIELYDDGDVDNGGKYAFTEPCETFAIEFGKTYEFSVSGSFDKGFVLKREK